MGNLTVAGVAEAAGTQRDALPTCQCLYLARIKASPLGSSR